jgi:hypothetical protein
MPTAPTAQSEHGRGAWGARQPGRPLGRGVPGDRGGRPDRAATVYARGGAFNCTMPDGNSITLPHPDPGWLPRGRAMQCPRRPRRPRADHVGVKVTYRYQWKTPIGHGSARSRRDAIQLDAHGSQSVIRRGRPAGATRDGAARARSSSMIVPLFLLFLLGPSRHGLRPRADDQLRHARGRWHGAALANGSKMADESLGTVATSICTAAVERVLDLRQGRPCTATSPTSTDPIYKPPPPGTEVGPVNVWTPAADPRWTAAQLQSLVVRVGLVHAHQQHQQPDPGGDLLHLPRRDAARPLMRLRRAGSVPRDRSLVMALNPTD